MVKRKWFSFRTAFALYGYVHIPKHFEKVFSSDELKFIRYHEKGHCVFHHSFKFLFFDRVVLEREAQSYAIKCMLADGYSFEDCLRFELSYRLYDKYGLSLNEYKKLFGGV